MRTPDDATIAAVLITKSSQPTWVDGAAPSSPEGSDLRGQPDLGPAGAALPELLPEAHRGIGAAERVVEVAGPVGCRRPTGGVRATVRAGVDLIKEMLPVLNARRRALAPISELVLGLNCGGSDGYSGITANPALGLASDRLVAAGGTSILGETPEVFGAEHLLTRRAVSERVGRRLLERLDWWQGYAQAGGGSLDNNPSPGNKAGGLTTILEKSLGAVARASAKS